MYPIILSSTENLTNSDASDQVYAKISKIFSLSFEYVEHNCGSCVCDQQQPYLRSVAVVFAISGGCVCDQRYLRRHEASPKNQTMETRKEAEEEPAAR